MEIQIKLYGSSKMLSENETLLIELPENSNIGQLRNSLKKLINERYSKNNLGNLPNSAAFFSDRNEVINDNYQLKNKEILGDDKGRVYYVFKNVTTPVSCGWLMCLPGNGYLEKTFFNYQEAVKFVTGDNKEKKN